MKILFLNPPRKARRVDEWWVRQNYGTPVLEKLLKEKEYKIFDHGFAKLKVEE